LFTAPFDARNRDQPSEFLLVEELGIGENIPGNENLETRRRLAKLTAAKAVVTQYTNIWQRIPSSGPVFDNLEAQAVANPQSYDTKEEVGEAQRTASIWYSILLVRAFICTPQ